MSTTIAGRGAQNPQAEHLSQDINSADMVNNIAEWLSDAKAEDVVTIDLSGKSSVADFMIVASGRSERHVGAIAEQIMTKCKEVTGGPLRIEGKDTCDWCLLDTGDVVVHIFRPEVREFYNLEKMWMAERPADEPTAH